MPAAPSRRGEGLVLIDTSSWIHFLRRDGDASARRRVSALLESGTARWCAMVRLELWNGARGAREKRVLMEFERLIPELETSPAVWDEAFAHKLPLSGSTGSSREKEPAEHVET